LSNVTEFKVPKCIGYVLQGIPIQVPSNMIEVMTTT
jgi:hypothetical protein